MTIRSRLLSLLLPTLILFLILISLFFFLNWNSEIKASFRANLKSIVVTTAELLSPEEIAWINEHRDDPQLDQNPLYRRMEKLFHDLKNKLPIDNLYVVSIEPVKWGEKVLLDQPLSESNKINDGTNSELAFRQVYLLDSTSNKIYQDYSESNEQLIYYNKMPLITPIYRGKGSAEEFMTGYAPIKNEQGKVIALVGADVNLDLLHRFVRHAILVMLLSTLIATSLVAVAVMFIANKITEPVSQLKNAALALAAGEYEEKIAVKGPKEISELASTFNTMRECLLDNINKLRQSSFLREKLYGEHECAALLQSRMLDGVIERFNDPRLTIKQIVSSPSSAIQGLKVDLTPSENSISIKLSESLEEGFEGVYSLLNGEHQIAGEISSEILFLEKKVLFQNLSMPLPLLWSASYAKFLPDNLTGYTFAPGDFLFLFNQELELAFPQRQTVRDWMSKVMAQFANDKLELMCAMLTSELNFCMKKQHAAYHVHIFCIKI